MADLTSGLSTLAQLDAPVPHLRISWMAWDSPFRGTGLHVGDQIMAVNGQPIVSASITLAEQTKLTPTLIGQYAEHQGFEAAGLRQGSTLTLSVRRRASTQGWAELNVQAPLAERTTHRNAANQELLGQGGPQTYDSDNFNSGGWGAWYNESLQRTLSYLLDVDRHTGTFVSRYEAKALRETHGDRVAFASMNYPGTWSQALKADYDNALAIGQGRPITLPPDALAFRRRGEALAAQVRAQAQAAWADAQARYAPDTIPAFPAVNPVRGDIRAVTGKVVVLPTLRNKDWITDGGRGWFTAGGDSADSADSGWYFIDAQSEAAQAMLLAQRRYTKLVDPNIAAQWVFIARITDQPRLTVINEQAHFGLVAEPLAALVGDILFVDLTQRQGTEAAFAGEAGLLDDTPDLPPDDAPPAAVIQALVGAVKMGDLALWRALHAQWSIERRPGDEGQPDILLLHPFEQPPNESMFELSRRSVMGRVLDAQVAWVGDAQLVLDGSRFAGAQSIDEVEVWLDHVGDFSAEGDGTRTFQDVTVSARWRLQRVNKGPWRVAQAQPI